MGVLHVLRVEGVNFTATLDDTQDLSTIRGASLGLLAAPETVLAALAGTPGVSEARLVLRGASLAAAVFEAEAPAAADARRRVTAALRQPGADGAPFQHLSFVVDVVRGADDAALRTAQAANRARQFRQWTVALPAFVPGTAGADPLDRIRPGTELYDLPEGRRALAPGVAARRDYGRTMRQRFYRTHAPQAAERIRDSFAFVDDFRSLMVHPPAGLPVSTRNHLALVYADGNRFGAVARSVGAEAFARALLPLQERLLGQVVDWFRTGALGEAHTAFAVPDPTQPRLRLETLLWGGDELAFVMPAWLAFAFIEGFFALTRDWTVAGHPLTFAVGAVFAHHKAPIRQVRSLAKAVADDLKQACDRPKIAPNGVLPSAVGIEIFESLAIPESGLTAYREGLYGPGAKEPGFALNLVLPGDRIDAVRAQIGLIAAGGDGAPIRRAQLYRVLAKARAEDGGLAGDDADALADRTLRDYRSRVRGQSMGEALRLPRLPGAPLRPLGLELAMLAGFWDYADPFAGALPSMIEAGR